MSLRLYWWSPTRSARSIAGEVVRHGSAWCHLIAGSRPSATNFGDELSRELLREHTGETIEWAPLRHADVVSVGSILDRYLSAGSRALVLGSGIRDPRGAKTNNLDRSRFVSVRGKLTRELLGLDTETLLGDPALALFGKYHRNSPRRKLSVLPHFNVFGSSAGRRELRALRSAGFDVIYPNRRPSEVVADVASSDFVATSSLHGLIVSHTLGVPACLISFGSVTHAEPSFKYNDYMSVFDLPATAVPASWMMNVRQLEGVRDQAALQAAAVTAQIETVAANVISAYGELTRALGEPGNSAHTEKI